MGVKGISTADETKRCSKCDETKPLEEFYAHDAAAQGARPDCKKCFNEYHARWARARYVPKTGRHYDVSPEAREARRLAREQRGALRRRLDEEVRLGVKVCRACGQSKSLDGFRQLKKEPPRFDATCRACCAAKARAKRAKLRPPRPARVPKAPREKLPPGVCRACRQPKEGKRCRPCRVASQRRYSERHGEELHERARRRYHSTPQVRSQSRERIRRWRSRGYVVREAVRP